MLNKLAMPQVEKLDYTALALAGADVSINTDGYNFLSIIFNGDIDPLTTFYMLLNDSVKIPLYGRIDNLPLNQNIKKVTFHVTRGAAVWVAPFNGTMSVVLSNTIFQCTPCNIAPTCFIGPLTLAAGTLRRYLVGMACPLSETYTDSGIVYMPPKGDKYGAYNLLIKADTKIIIAISAIMTDPADGAPIGNHTGLGAWKGISIPYAEKLTIQVYNSDAETDYTLTGLYLYPVHAAIANTVFP